MTRLNDTQRENFDFDRPERCAECGLEPDQCNCPSPDELDEIL